MGDDFQAGVCGSSWWSSPRGSIGFSPCLIGMNDYGSFGLPSHDLISNQGSILFDQFIQKPSESHLVDSPPQIFDISCSSTTTTATKDWNPNLISGSETNYQSPMMQENMTSSRMNYRQNSPNNQIQKDSTINEVKQTTSTQGFSLSSMSSSSYSYPSNLIENLFGDDPLPLENLTMNFPTTTNYRTNLNELLLPSLPTPSLSQQQEINHFNIANNTPFRNTSTAAPSDISVGIFPSSQAHFVEKSNFQSLKQKSNNGAIPYPKKSKAEPALKKRRVETPSPLPTFKVRKEKLGDRVTALQQLVSPFGKTDTASVLQEAIEYIKFLHDQVIVLSTPYIKKGTSIQQQKYDSSKDPEETKQDLKGRGLCLVPISSTFPVANETTVDFWTPTL